MKLELRTDSIAQTFVIILCGAAVTTSTGCAGFHY